MSTQPTTQRSIVFSGYRFEGPHTNVAALRNAAGVYVICDKRTDGRWYVLDVGESSRVRDRIESHERSACWQRHAQGPIGVAVLYTPGWTDSQRRGLESRIRDDYAPPCGER